MDNLLKELQLRIVSLQQYCLNLQNKNSNLQQNEILYKQTIEKLINKNQSAQMTLQLMITELESKENTL